MKREEREMLLDPEQLVDDLDRLEDIEKASLRLVVQAIYDYRDVAVEIFREEGDLVADIGEGPFSAMVLSRTQHK
jgi:hypothetical protein